MVGLPSDIPTDIERAIRIAESCRFCRFLGDLQRAGNGEFIIEADIGPERRPLLGAPQPWYRVRFLIPKQFPYAVAHAVPLKPDLRWNPHQNGDWPELGQHANVMCPPRQHCADLGRRLL